MAKTAKDTAVGTGQNVGAAESGLNSLREDGEANLSRKVSEASAELANQGGRRNHG